jgi:hypothetical protein
LHYELTGPKCICPDSFHVSLARRKTDYSVESGTERPQRSLKIYLIEARHADGRLDLHVLDWWNLLGLAAQYSPHLPEEEGPRLRKANPQLRGIAGPVPRAPYKDPRNHFGGKRKWLVGEFIELCQKGILDIRKTT